MVHFQKWCASTSINENGQLNPSFSLIGQYWPIYEQFKMADDIFMQYLLHYSPKERVFKERSDPFVALTDEEFRKRFRLSKTAVSLILKQVS